MYVFYVYVLRTYAQFEGGLGFEVMKEPSFTRSTNLKMSNPKSI